MYWLAYNLGQVNTYCKRPLECILIPSVEFAVSSELSLVEPINSTEEAAFTSASARLRSKCGVDNGDFSDTLTPAMKPTSERRPPRSDVTWCYVAPLQSAGHWETFAPAGIKDAVLLRDDAIEVFPRPETSCLQRYAPASSLLRRFSQLCLASRLAALHTTTRPFFSMANPFRSGAGRWTLTLANLAQGPCPLLWYLFLGSSFCQLNSDSDRHATRYSGRWHLVHFRLHYWRYHCLHDLWCKQ